MTPAGFRTALFCLKVHARILRPGLAHLIPATPVTDTPLRAAFDRVEREIARVCAEAQLAA